MAPPPNIYAGCPVDRAHHRRRDTDWLAAARAAPQTRIVPVWRARTLVDGPDDAPRTALLPAGRAWEGGEEPVLLGVMDGAAVFAADLSALDAPETHPAVAAAAAGGARFLDLRTVGGLMAPADAALAAYARGLTWWNARHRFCGVCGAPAAGVEAGHLRICTDPACATTHYPRTDPAVIMLVHDGGDRCVLHRQPRFAPGMYSVLAGFVEPGESLEEAVAREVLEEVGLRVTDVRYHSSQPWPFPSQLMIGFTARALDTAITVQEDEIEEAFWVTRDRLRAAGPDDPHFRPPRRDSIARRLMDEWLDERPDRGPR
ncbi:NAD(+) diphosphatase [Azospirillum halopraeferens]|uniref:NAD(+) diphosphatase n=1 Tax=Azospirillum halopraeferens TaxID=34010 RepID=UPI000414A059|nr:NAD(+) diphosphatase [Azospirillum halopraeferens]